MKRLADVFLFTENVVLMLCDLGIQALWFAATSPATLKYPERKAEFLQCGQSSTG